MISAEKSTSPATSHNPFGAWSNPYLAAALIGLCFVLTALFNANPDLDIAAAQWFFDGELCASSALANRCLGFAVAGHPLASAVREVLNAAPKWLGVAIAVFAVIDWLGGRRWSDTGFRKKAVVVGALILGPALLVNGILKVQWGRPRPWMTDLFGGTMPFVPAGEMAGLCASNCSFVSGEAAAGGWFLALSILFPKRYQPLAFACLAAIGIGMALLRVAFGAHYLSDVVLGWLSAVAVFAVLAVVAQRWTDRGLPAR